MTDDNKTIIIYEQVRKNQIKTFILIVSYVVVIFLICFSIGYYMDDILIGILIGVFVVFILTPIQLLTGNYMMGAKTNWSGVNMSDPKQNKVHHLVEGLSLAAGMQNMPSLYIIPTNTPNAFAGGLSLKNAYIGVTTGLIELLDEPEMEGVLAHEMSHIIQRDVLVSTVSIYLMSAAIVLGTILYRLTRTGRHYNNNRSNDSKDDKQGILVLLAIGGLVLSYVIKFVARIINLAISRKREYVADANAVRLCGYSEGIANALETIAKYSPDYSREQVDDLGGDEMMCLYIYNPTNWIMPLFSTHPPIEERIKLLRNMY